MVVLAPNSSTKTALGTGAKNVYQNTDISFLHEQNS